MFVSLLLVGCTEVQAFKNSLDYKSFKATGGTLFSKPRIVTSKEIHFDTGKLLGREIILQGEVATVGQFETHLVVNDETGRMLVVLTHVPEASKLLLGYKGGVISVLGTVERGKKGLPYVLARSLNSGG